MLAAIAPLHAQQSDTLSITVSGTVVDPRRSPIEGAEIGIPGTNITTMSSSAGQFVLRVPQRDELLIRIRRPGYKSQLLKVRGQWSGIVQMEPGAFELPEVQVTARNAKPAEYAGTTKYDDFFRRQRQGFGIFIDRNEIERRAPTRVVELLQARAGVRVDIRPTGVSGGTIVAFSRCNEFPPKINVYSDGRRQMPEGLALRLAEENAAPPRGRTSSGQGDQVEAIRREAKAMIGTILERIAIGDIELVEVFRGPGELPPEFNDGTCGAIAIWTRQGGR